MLNIINKVEESPGDDSTKIKCIVCEDSTPDDSWEVIMPIEEYELILSLNRLAKQLKIYPAMMNELWEKIRNFSEAKYKLGLVDCTKP